MNGSKALLTVLLVLLFILTSGEIVQAAPIVVLDGEQLQFEVAPVIEEGRTLVPLRAIFESMGAEVDWDEESKTAIGIKGDTIVKLPIGSSTPTINGQKTTIEVPGKIVNDRTLAPLRFVGEAFGGTVKWDENTQTITINSSEMPENVPDTELDTVEIAKRSESVVMVTCTGNGFESQGSGVIVDHNGLIATNYHVIEGCSSGKVILADGQEFQIAGVVDYDAGFDLAVLKVEASDLPAVLMGDSRNIKLGQDVVAIGSPLGLYNTISTGIVSGIRDIEGQTVIQISAPITNGSSGGGIFNKKAELIGITSAGMGEADLNFAIPVHQLQPLLHDNEQYKSLEEIVPDTGAIAMEYRELEAYLNEYQSQLSFSNYIIEPAFIIVDEYYDGKMVEATFYLDHENSMNLLSAAQENGEVESYMKDLAYYMLELYPEKNVGVEFIFTDYFAEYPEFIPNDWFEWDDEMEEWFVFKPLVETTDYYSGKMETYWDPY